MWTVNQELVYDAAVLPTTYSVFTHQVAAVFLPEMMSWLPSLNYNVKSKN